VGLKLWVVRKLIKLANRSPSHTVGLEHPEMVRITYKLVKSPSHIVGLKHLPKSLKIKTSTLSKLKQPTERTH